MGRRKKDEGFVQQKVSIPATLMARFQRLHWDPVLSKTKYGAISTVLVGLMMNYVNTMESGGTEQLYRKVSDSPERYEPVAAPGTNSHA